jgi:uncharacterized protein (TIGR03790 family)
MKHALSSFFRLLASAILTGLAAAPLPARAGGGPYNTLLVVNAVSRDSRKLGEYYAERHGLPPANVCTIHVDPHKPNLSPGDFEASVLRPVLDHLAREKLDGQIHFLVLSMDIPTRVNYFNGITAALFYGYKPQPPDAPPCHIVPDSLNQYYAAERAYSSSAGWNRTNMPIAFALTAPDLKTAKAVVDRAVESASSPPPANAVFCLHGSGDAARNVRHRTYARAALPFAWSGASGDVDVRPGSTGVPDRPVALYMGGRAYIPTNFPGAIRFAPGAIADHLTSCGGMVPDPCLKQSTVWDWFRLGATASYGTVAEPCAYEAKFPDPMIAFWYRRGFTAGEALAMSVRNPYQGLFAGDPLAAPFARPPSVQVLSPEPGFRTAGPLTLVLSMKAHPDSGAPPVYLDLYLDGKYVRPVTRPLSPTGNDLLVQIGDESFSYTVAPDEDLYRATAGLAWAVNSRANGRVKAKAVSDRIELTVPDPLDPGTGRPLPVRVSADRGFGKNLYIGLRTGTPQLVVDETTGEGHACLFVHLGSASAYAFEYPLDLSALPPGPHTIGLVVRDGTAVQAQSLAEFPVEIVP